MNRTNQLADAERLNLISQRVGYALWQLQELEGVAATYLVVVARATQGMGAEQGNALLEKALSQTFGVTVKAIIKAGKMPAELSEPVQRLLTERNWLVHGSRASSRSAVRHESDCSALIARVDAIAASALYLVREFGAQTESFVKARGVSAETIDTEAARILKKWHTSNAL
ncbi:MAG TPA: hypothetical protein VK663_02035 [Burkholderiales bacterium]|nr:hypothetical protein [Burkholderiales bacterium]